jgi:hypothetical protein
MPRKTNSRRENITQELLRTLKRLRADKRQLADEILLDLDDPGLPGITYEARPMAGTGPLEAQESRRLPQGIHFSGRSTMSVGRVFGQSPR